MVRNITISDDEDEVIIGKKKTKTGKEQKTYVFDIELTEYTNDSYAEYNWKALVKKEEDKDIDSDIEIIEIDINDTKPKQKKSNKPVDPEDDYDLDDDFIDDTEVNDEEVPDEVSTACGGFYINTGSLKFKYKEGLAKDADKVMSLEEKEKMMAGAKNQTQQSSIKNYFGSSIPKPTSLPQVAGKRCKFAKSRQI